MDELRKNDICHCWECIHWSGFYPHRELGFCGYLYCNSAIRQLVTPQNGYCHCGRREAQDPEDDRSN